MADGREVVVRFSGSFAGEPEWSFPEATGWTFLSETVVINGAEEVLAEFPHGQIMGVRWFEREVLLTLDTARPAVEELAE